MRGIASGGCLSAKDRKGTSGIPHTDAMFIFYALYDRFPKLTDKKDRKFFISIFKTLHNSLHNIKWAASNAPGSEGIENIDPYATILPNIFKIIPKDLRKAIFKKEEELEENDFLAGLFKPERYLKTHPPSQLQKTEDVSSKSVFLKPTGLVTIENDEVLKCDLSGRSKKPKPITLLLSKKAEQKKDQTKATYFPIGSSSKYDRNTLEIKDGNITNQIDNAADCAIAYLAKNPEPTQKIILNGRPPAMLEALQWVFIAALGVDPKRIVLLPPSVSPITIEENKDGTLEIPAKFKQTVNSAKKLVDKPKEINQILRLSTRSSA